MKARTARVIAAMLVAAALPVPGEAHDIPDEIVVQTYVAPRDSRLQVLLRVPLIAIADANLPKDGVGYLAMRYLDPALREAANQISNGIVFLEGDERLTGYELANARISLPSNRSFDIYDSALAHVRGPRLPDTTQIYYNQGFLDLELLFPIRSQDSPFSMRVLFGRGLAQRTATYITFIKPDASVRHFRIHDDTPLVHLDPSGPQTAWVFLTAGFYRFLEGLDHLLFVVALVIPFRRVRELIFPIGAFGIAFFASLAAFTLGGSMSTAPGAWFTPAVGAVTALSLVYLAGENGLGLTRAALRRRSIVALVFGLAHGLAFAIALQDTLQFAGAHPVIGVSAFTIGLELGIIIILAIAVPALNLLFTHVAERAGTIVLSLLIGHAGWHWMTERARIAEMSGLPALDLPLMLTIVRWLLALTVVGGAVWFLAGLIKKKPAEPEIAEKSIVDSR